MATRGASLARTRAATRPASSMLNARPSASTWLIDAATIGSCIASISGSVANPSLRSWPLGLPVSSSELV